MILNDYEKMLYYYLKSIELNNNNAMNNLGNYYENQQNYEKMFEYYLMAIAFE